MTTPAFDLIVKEYGAMIRRIASAYEAKPHLAQELTQDIYLAVWQALPKFRNQSTPRTFIARIATNRAISHVVREAKAPLSVDLDDQMPAPELDPESLAIARDRKDRLMNAMRALPLPLRQCAALAAEGLTAREIADVLGISSNAAAVRLSRAREQLRKSPGVSHE